MHVCRVNIYTVIILTGIPPSPPMNITEMDRHYGLNLSSITLVWNEAESNEPVENYIVTVTYGSGHASYSTYTYTNSSRFNLSAVPYNENITVEIVSVNCIGVSSPTVHTVYIRKFVYTYVHGTIYVYTCNYYS